jgi:hypothetical protein
LIVESGLGFTTRRFANGSSSSESEHVRSTTLSFGFSSLALSVDEVAVMPELTSSAKKFKHSRVIFDCIIINDKKENHCSTSPHKRKGKDVSGGIK